MIRSWAWAAAILVGLALAAGCQKGRVEEQAAEEAEQQPSPELQALLKLVQETGQSVEQLRQSIAQWKAAQEASTAFAPVRTDLAVLRRLRQKALAAVEAKNSNELQAILTRMNRVARAVLAELPGQQVAVWVERALNALDQEPPNAQAAAAAILSAIDACVKAREPTLVPDVVKTLEAAQKSVTSDVAAARQQLMQVVSKCGKDKAGRIAYYMVAELEGAFKAAVRDAWPVVKAELEQVGNLIGQLEGMMTAAEQAQPQAEAGQTPAGRPAGEAPAEQGKKPPAEGAEETAPKPPAQPPQAAPPTGPPPAPGAAPPAAPPAGQGT